MGYGPGFEEFGEEGLRGFAEEEEFRLGVECSQGGGEGGLTVKSILFC